MGKLIVVHIMAVDSVINVWMQWVQRAHRHKILNPKISPGAYIFQRSFLRLILGGACIWRGLSTEGNFTFHKRLGQPYSWKDIYLSCFVVLCICGQFPSNSPPGCLYLEGRFNEGFFALQIWGAYICRGLYMDWLIFGILHLLQ